MTVVDTLGETVAAQADAARASILADADALDRVAWSIYVAIFAVLPLAVVTFRTVMLAWHYYLAGAFFLGGALAICALDLRRMRLMGHRAPGR